MTTALANCSKGVFWKADTALSSCSACLEAARTPKCFECDATYTLYSDLTPATLNAHICKLHSSNANYAKFSGCKEGK